MFSKPRAQQDRAVLDEVGAIVATRLDLDTVSALPESLHLNAKKSSGRIQSATVCFLDGHIQLAVEIARAGEGAVAGIAPLWQRLQALERSRLDSQRDADGTVKLICRMVMQPTPLGIARRAALEDELDGIQQLAEMLSREMDAAAAGTPAGQLQLDAAYEKVKPVLDRIAPVAVPADSEAGRFTFETGEYLAAGLTVALCASTVIESTFLAAAIAARAEETGTSLGRLMAGAFSAANLPALAAQAPGWIAVEAAQLAAASHPYQLAAEMSGTLQQLAQQRAGVLVSGPFDTQQRIFAAGQGHRPDPLFPVVRDAPAIPMQTLIGFALGGTGIRGGLTAAARDQLTAAVADAIVGLPRFDALRVLPHAARHAVNAWRSGSTSATGFASRAAGLRRTVAGFGSSTRRGRSEQLQRALNAIAAAEDPAAFLRAELLGQDAALDELGARLLTEILTRPDYQPLRLLLQGPPGVGKSESLKLLATRAGVHYEFVDAASFADVHSATAQMFGSAPGLVSSDRPGRLERSAQHRPGTLLEIADLDHAPPRVVAAVADLYLKCMDEGESDAASGASFSTANIILAFTMNLPEEHRLRTPMGWNATTGGREQVKQRTAGALRQHFSSAFLDRAGQPIVFQPLDAEALAGIARQVAAAGTRVAAERLGLDPDGVDVDAGVGRSLVSAFRTPGGGTGARALREFVRTRAAAAVAAYARRVGDRMARLRVSPGPEGTVVIQAVAPGADAQASGQVS